ncbi:hypothetical protein OTB20_09385, partial [Streptomyces sp. H27-H1]|nr:hypothetical protein [Streptomyces sp. H27-H1]
MTDALAGASVSAGTAVTDPAVVPDAPAVTDAPAGTARAADRLDPAARPYADALAALFPDLGGRVTDAEEARRILAAAPRAARPAAVGAVEDREVPGPPGAPPVPVRVYHPDPERWPGRRAARV